MSRARSIVIAVVTVAFSWGGLAHALVLADKSPEQKHRKDVAKQSAKLAKCLTKVWETCEKKGADPSVAECDVTDGTVDGGVDPNAAANFAPSIAKCISKLDFMNKAPDGANASTAYQAFGCPGDANPAPGLQPFTDMDAYELGVIEAVKVAVDQFALLPPVTGCDPMDGKCFFAEVKRLNQLTQGIGKCQEKCESDYKDKAGNGGPVDSFDPCSAGGRCTDDQTPCFSDANCSPATCNYTFSNLAFRQGCADKVFGKAIAKNPWPPLMQSAVLSVVLGQLNSANDDNYNRTDNCP